VAFLDLLPDSIEHTEESGIGLPEFPFLMALAGYLLILTLEKMVFNSHELMEHHSHSGGQSTTAHQASQPSATPQTSSSPFLGSGDLVQAAINPRKSFAIIVNKESEVIDSEESTKSLITTAKDSGTANRYAPYLLAIALSVHSV